MGIRVFIFWVRWVLGIGCCFVVMVDHDLFLLRFYSCCYNCFWWCLVYLNHLLGWVYLVFSLHGWTWMYVPPLLNSTCCPSLPSTIAGPCHFLLLAHLKKTWSPVMYFTSQSTLPLPLPLLVLSEFSTAVYALCALCKASRYLELILLIGVCVSDENLSARIEGNLEVVPNVSWYGEK